MFLRAIGGGRGLVSAAKNLASATGKRNIYHLRVQHCSEEAIIERYLTHFNRTDIDGWDVRQGMNDLAGLDMVPNPEMCSAVLCACRRVNDYAIAIRFLESVKNKCGDRVNEIYPYILQEIAPLMEELGVDTPEQLGYDVPEMCLESVYDIH